MMARSTEYLTVHRKKTGKSKILRLVIVDQRILYGGQLLHSCSRGYEEEAVRNDNFNK